MDVRDDAIGYSQGGEGRGQTCLHPGRAALEGGSYLKATKDMRVVFRRGEDLKLSLFADVDNADRCNDRRSVLGVAVMLGNTVLSADSTTQHCVTLSTTKAKYFSMVHEAKKALEIIIFLVHPHLSGSAIDM